jgi:N-acetylglucosaminyldiphosphoundecaprenol N-acetyl-beta-D-mannosaminyltransferase
MAAALARVDDLVESRSRAALVATVNPEFVMHARHDDEFRRALDHAGLALPDGIGVVWALRRQGCTVPERVTGVDLVPRLAELCERRRYRLYLLGAGPGVAARAAERLASAHPQLEIVGAEPGSPLPRHDAATVAMVNEARPDVLLVAYGHPRQELWVARNRERLQAPVAVGVGGTFDILAGSVRRAPDPLRRAHLEWLWRLWLEPWRARRMAVLPVYAVRVLASPGR